MEGLSAGKDGIRVSKRVDPKNRKPPEPAGVLKNFIPFKYTDPEPNPILAGSTSALRPVRDTLGENWRSIDMALRDGYRGLPGGSSLAQLLAAQRGVRNRKAQPPLVVPEVLSWADAFFEAHGRR